MTSTNVISAGRLLTRLGDQHEGFADSIRKLSFVDVFRSGKSVTTAEPETAVKERLSANFQATLDRIADHGRKRNLLNKSNLETIVNIHGKDYTVAEALIVKAYVIPQKRALIAEISNQISRSRTLYQTEVRSYDGMIKDRDPAQIEALKDFVPSIYDITTALKALIDDVDAFEQEVNAALTEVNAVTQIDLS